MVRAYRCNISQSRSGQFYHNLRDPKKYLGIDVYKLYIESNIDIYIYIQLLSINSQTSIDVVNNIRKHLESFKCSN